MAFPLFLPRQIARWQEKGLIDEKTAAALLADVESQRGRGFGLGNTLAVLGALLLGAAIITLIAANWEAMPRLLRVALIFVAIWAGYLGGAWRQAKGDKMFAPALYVFGALAFGAGVALVGQMYHLAGDTPSAALIWTGGVMVSALLLRSRALAITGMAVAIFYLFSFLDNGFVPDRNYTWIAPLLAVCGLALAWYTKSRATAHLVALFLIAYFVIAYGNLDSHTPIWLAVVIGLCLFLIDGLRPDISARLGGVGPALGAYGLAGALLALEMVQFEDFARNTGGRVTFGIVILAIAIGALMLSGRRNALVRWVAYVAFSLEVLYLAFMTVGTLVGTSGFFLTAGILLLLLAVFVARMERRLHKPALKLGVSP
ncbi:hypothetical protein GCM10011491_07570 [Brucella endophytica]|uniref:DUF2157 domain-containing protein n=1 Tax=Brucella endophytica TaxID=1963359 RepID=A0A916WAZ3_9HYPH|nr:DUF2157 domain-containing protein [Brucella endophytica]GGA82636.1 hypothetical protein GCM10011491_07570 [Brucella endophytica]